MLNEAIEMLQALGQEHLIPDLSLFDEEAIFACVEELRCFSPAFVKEQKTSWQNRTKTPPFEPLTELPLPCDKKVKKTGKSATILLAGGQGSRLGTQSPKGCFSFFGRSLFERHCENIGDEPLAIMTSPLNHMETVAFFQNHQLFGLKELSFFSQGTLPLLDTQGRWFWQAPGLIAIGPDGNGSVFQALKESRLLAKFEKKGIETIHIVPVDNPLALPCELPEGADIAIKCIRLENKDEPMGRLVRMKGRLSIVEFAECSEVGRAENLYANTGLMTLDIRFMRLLAKKKFSYHWAFRGGAWKGERFIVDALRFTEKSQAFSSPRDTCYAPLKEKNSIVEIERLLMERERKLWYTKQP
jgi:UDP-N-acetylglucosamine/UDP-N-acetylgalactosamine diphosphorylase